MTNDANHPGRRDVLRALLVGGTAAVLSREDEILAAHLAEESKQGQSVPQDPQLDSLSGASRTHTNWAKFADLKEKVGTATIKGIKVSKMILGCNLIGGWAHARDLLYASDLVKAYHTRDKITATFKMAEACGINTFMGAPSQIDIMNDYWEKADGTLQFFTQSMNLDVALQSIEKGATAAYIQGNAGDKMVQENKFDEMAAFLERVRKEGVPAGLGGHRIETVKAMAEKGLEPDFWVKTIHHGNYWSRHADKKEHDNVYDRVPEETIEFMATQKQPWIGFKVLAAGAIHPRSGFNFALESGADFLCVGMYDFQIVDDINIYTAVAQSQLKRNRPWCYS